MADLFWPGDHRAGDLMSDAALLAALVAVENAWLSVLVDAAVAPPAARTDLIALISPEDAEAIAEGAERDGNPVTGLVALLRDRTADPAARWLHRGLTSQDVLDTALLLCLRDALGTVRAQLTAQVQTLVGLVEIHRDTPMLARTLAQPALPSTAGMKFAGWLSATLDAADTVATLPALPVQAGGAAGTMAAATELAGSADAAVQLTDALARVLNLSPAPPWHTARSTITRHGDAFVTCCDTWGHVANDIITGSRGEIGELTEGSGGGSSTMPHKVNPVLSILLRRNALTAPALGATLHAASAASVDERADGGWHAEWATLRTLTRRTVVAASQASDLLTGLQVHTDRAHVNLTTAHGLLAEQHTMSELASRPAGPTYLGAADHLIDAALYRARHHLKESQ
ncbi:MAG: 3-carboxy-cis,cis-muconate cycloisomerase [Mycobacterium sp.]